ncbi:MAG: 3-hydroxyacyl-CoA dehydrogenase family protein [Gemmatimonadales bacterium]
MTSSATPRVAVIGAGQIGRGWAALLVSRGWSVGLFDPVTAVAESARVEVGERVGALTQAGLADASAVRAGLATFRSGRSLLQVITDADWVIEAGPDDLAQRQRTLEQIEQVCRLAAILTSSSQRFHASDLCARLRRPERLLCVNPYPPVEYLPVIEVIPGPRTEPACTADVELWLRRLGRWPVVLKKEVPGNISGRIAAAVWREALQLVLDGVIAVEDLDRAVAAGPALALTAAGPGLGLAVAAGDRDLSTYLSTVLLTYQEWWAAHPARTSVDGEELHRLVRAISRAYDAQLPTQTIEHRRRLAALVKALQQP